MKSKLTSIDREMRESPWLEWVGRGEEKTEEPKYVWSTEYGVTAEWLRRGWGWEVGLGARLPISGFHHECGS